MTFKIKVLGRKKAQQGKTKGEQSISPGNVTNNAKVKGDKRKSVTDE